MEPTWTAPIVVRQGGLNLTEYARTVWRNTDYEVQYAQLMVEVDNTPVPIRLAAAAFQRLPWNDGTGSGLPEMRLEAIPAPIRRRYVIQGSGQTLYPFEDAPHVVHDGIILHGHSPMQRAEVYNLIRQAGYVPVRGCELPSGRARPPEPGDRSPAYPFMQLRLMPSVPSFSTVPIVPPWLSPQPTQAQRPQRSPAIAPHDPPDVIGSGVYAMQSLAEHEMHGEPITPYVRVSREIAMRARGVHTAASSIQAILQQERLADQHGCLRPATSACWELTSEMDSVLAALLWANSDADMQADQ